MRHADLVFQSCSESGFLTGSTLIAAVERGRMTRTYAFECCTLSQKLRHIRD